MAKLESGKWSGECTKKMSKPPRIGTYQRHSTLEAEGAIMTRPSRQLGSQSGPLEGAFLAGHSPGPPRTSVQTSPPTVIAQTNSNGMGATRIINEFNDRNLDKTTTIKTKNNYPILSTVDNSDQDNLKLGDRVVEPTISNNLVEDVARKTKPKVPLLTKLNEQQKVDLETEAFGETVVSPRPYLRDIPKTQSLDVRTNEGGGSNDANKSKTRNEPSAITREMRSRLLVSQQSRSLGRDDSCESMCVESPCCSPRALRRRQPMRESRRVSIDASGNYLQLNQYKLLDPIGQGSYGIVKLAYNQEDDTHYAMKILSKRKLLRKAGLFGRAPPLRKGRLPPDPLDLVRREIAVLKKLDHPNVVKLVEVLDDPLEDHLYLVFELVERGPVMQPNAQPLSESLARSYFRDVVLGIEYLHYQNIIHRDIKPANLLVGEDGRVLVADLGGSCESSGGGGRGTPAFLAPEAFPCANPQQITKAADIWSMGVTLYFLVTATLPWKDECSASLYSLILKQPLSFPSNVSQEVQDFISRMLDKDVKTRISIAEIKTNDWLTIEGKFPLPSEEENCQLVEVTDEDVAKVVTSIPKVSTLILIKTMLKKHSFQNPFLSRPGRLSRGARSASAPGAYLGLPERQASIDSFLPALTEADTQSSSDQRTDSAKGESSSSNTKASNEVIDREARDPELVEYDDENSTANINLIQESHVNRARIGFKFGRLNSITMSQDEGTNQGEEKR